jgi:hypothetical protein
MIPSSASFAEWPTLILVNRMGPVESERIQGLSLVTCTFAGPSEQVGKGAGRGDEEPGRGGMIIAEFHLISH